MPGVPVVRMHFMCVMMRGVAGRVVGGVMPHVIVGGAAHLRSTHAGAKSPTTP